MFRIPLAITCKFLFPFFNRYIPSNPNSRNGWNAGIEIDCVNDSDNLCPLNVLMFLLIARVYFVLGKKLPFNVNKLAQIAAIESLKDKNFVKRSVKHNFLWAKRIKIFLNKLNIETNDISANFFLLNFDKSKFSAKHVFKKLESKGIILRSTEEGYNIKNKLRLTIGSSKENIKFMKIMKWIFKK